MITPTIQSRDTRGFTLIETIIYVGLFSLIFTGIFMSIQPIFKNAERLTKNMAVEGETAFILAKLDYALSSTTISSLGVVATPSAGDIASELVLKYDSHEFFHFALDNSNTFCTPPLICKMLTVSENEQPALPLNASRVQIENFQVKHTAPTSGEPRYLDISFSVSGQPVGPVRYYIHF